MSQWSFADEPAAPEPKKPDPPAPAVEEPQAAPSAPADASATPAQAAPETAATASTANAPAMRAPVAPVSTAKPRPANSSRGAAPVNASPRAPEPPAPATPDPLAPVLPKAATVAVPRSARSAASNPSLISTPEPPLPPEARLAPEAQAALRAAQEAFANAQRAQGQGAPPAGASAPNAVAPNAPVARAPQPAPQVPSPQAPSAPSPQTTTPVANPPAPRPANAAAPASPPNAPQAPVPQAPSPTVPSPNAPSANAPVARSGNAATPPAAPSRSANVATPAPSVPNPAAPAPQVSSPQVPSPAAPRAGASGTSGVTVPSPANPNATPPLSSEPRPGAPAPKPAIASPVAPQMPAAPVSTASQSGSDMVRQREGDIMSFSPREVLDKLYPAASWLFRISVVLGAGALIFLVLGLLSARNLMPAPGTEITSEAYNQLLRAAPNLRTAAVVFCWALFGVALSCVVLAFDLRASGLVTALVGLGVRFGFPLLVFAGVGRNDLTGNVAQVFVQSLPLTLVVVIGMAKWAGDVALWMISVPDRVRSRADVGLARQAEAKQQAVAATAHMFSPCWNLPFCREVIRKQCPAFLAKKRCWKFGRGCYCDEEMISRIIRGEALDDVKAPTRQSRQGKPPCGRCHIYLEHQRHKFRALSPLAVPLTGVVVFFGWPYYEMLFNAVGAAIGPLFAGLTFDTRSITPDAIRPEDPTTADYGKVDPNQVGQIGLYIVGAMLGFLALIYISKFIEWAIYKAKW